MALGVLVCALAGCSGAEPASDTLPPLSSTAGSSTTSASPTGLPPQGPPDFPVPPEARTHDDAGAVAFAYYFVDLVDHQATIPAGQPLRDLGPDCATCNRLAQSFDDVATAGNHYVDGDLTITSVSAPGPPPEGGSEVVISFLIDAADETIATPSGDVVEFYPAAKGLGSGMRMIWSNSVQGWIVTGFDIG